MTDDDRIAIELLREYGFDEQADRLEYGPQLGIAISQPTGPIRLDRTSGKILIKSASVALPDWTDVSTMGSVGPEYRIMGPAENTVELECVFYPNAHSTDPNDSDD